MLRASESRDHGCRKRTRNHQAMEPVSSLAAGGAADGGCAKTDRESAGRERRSGVTASLLKPNPCAALAGRSALQEGPGQLREHFPPACLDNLGRDACLLKDHFGADFGLPEFKLDLTDAGEMLRHFQTEREQMGFVDDKVISKMVDRAVPGLLDDRKPASDREVEIDLHDLAVVAFD